MEAYLLKHWFSFAEERGGSIHRLPMPDPPGFSDVLKYLKSNDFVVYRAPLGEGEPKIVCQGWVITLKHLVEFANEHRAARRLPPFPLVLRAHRVDT